MPTSSTNSLVKFLALLSCSGVLLLILIFPLTTTAAFTKQINYQGKLTDASGSAVTDGAYSMVFKLYTVSSGGSAIWTETQSVTVTGGLFSVMLGSVTSLADINFNQALYLGLNVNGDGEMSPRKVIGAVPSSFTSARLDGNASSTLMDVSGYLTVTGDTTLADTTISGALITDKTWTASTGSLSSNYFNSTFSPTSASNAMQFGLNNNVTADGSVAQSFLAGQYNGAVYSGTANLNSLHGLLVNSELANSGSITSMYGITSNINNGITGVIAGGNVGTSTNFNAITTLDPLAGTTIDAYNFKSSFNINGGTLTNAYGAYIETPTISGAGALDNLYGLYIEDQNQGDTLNYNIYSAGPWGINYFGGQVGIATATPASGYKLAVEGNTILNGNLSLSGNVNNDLVVLGYASTTNGLFTQGNGHFGGNLTVAGKLQVIDGVNISDGTPTIVGGTQLALPATNGGSIAEKIIGNYLYMVFNSSTSTNQLRIIDISDVTQPKVVGGAALNFNLDDIGGARAIDVVGKYAYIGFEHGSFVDNKNFRIVDISNPANPKIVSDSSNLLAGNSIRAVKVVGKYAYLADYSLGFNIGLQIVDISNPYNPKTVSPATITGLTGETRSLDVVGKYAYLVSYRACGGINTNPGCGGNATEANAGYNVLRIVDISNPTNPVVVGGSGISLPFYARKIQVIGRYAYITFSAFGTSSGIDNGLAPDEALRIVDISNPANPTVVGGDNLNFNSSYEYGGGLMDIFVANNLAYATESGIGLRILDVASSTNPTITKTFSGFPTLAVWPVVVSGNYAYVGITIGPPGTDNETNVLQIVDLKGLKTGTANIGVLKVGELNLESNLTVAGLISANGLNLGVGGLITDGNLSVNSTNTPSYFGGQLGIGTTTPIFKLESVSDTDWAYFGNGRTSLNFSKLNTSYGDIPLISGVASTTAILGSDISGVGISDSLFLIENNDNPYLSFNSNDLSANSSITFATTSEELKFEGATGGYSFDTLTGGGTVCSEAGTGIISNTCPSSQEYKEDIAPTALNLEALLGLQVKTFKWKKTGQTDFGLIAEEVREVLPEIYSESGNIKGYRQDHLSFYLLQIAQRQEAELKALKSLISGHGSVSVGNDGLLVVKTLKAEDVFVENGLTVKDRITGQYNCIYIENGAIKNQIGTCADLSVTQNQEVADPGVINHDENQNLDSNDDSGSSDSVAEDSATTSPIEPTEPVL